MSQKFRVISMMVMFSVKITVVLFMIVMIGSETLGKW